MKKILMVIVLILASCSSAQRSPSSIVQAKTSVERIQHPLHANFGEMEVIGYNVSKEEFTPEYAIHWEPGTPSTQSVTVTWFLKKNKEFQDYQQPVMVLVASDGVAGAGAGGTYNISPMFDYDEPWAIGEVKTWTQELSAYPLIGDNGIFYYTTPSIGFWNPNSSNGEGRTPKKLLSGPTRLIGESQVYGPFLVCASLPYCKIMHMFH